jgi:hypothetical protein
MYLKVFGLVFKYYIYFYLISLLFVLAIFWLWLLYVDRLHLRESCRKIGKILKEYINKNVSTSYKEYIEKYLFYQLNTLSECIAGFTNGLIFDEPTVKVSLMVDKEIETNVETCEVEIQTDPIEPEIREVIKEVVKEVEKEVIREILVVKEVQVPVPIQTTTSTNVGSSSDTGFDIFGPKTKKYDIKPSLDDDNKEDYNTMVQEKPKRVRVKQKNISVTH